MTKDTPPSTILVVCLIATPVFDAVGQDTVLIRLNLAAQRRNRAQAGPTNAVPSTHTDESDLVAALPPKTPSQMRFQR